jgi:putative cell wall-binding protein
MYLYSLRGGCILKQTLKYFTIFLGLMGIILFSQVQEVKASATSSRLMGDDRFLTAIAVSQEGWAGGAETVILTNNYAFPDALSAAPLAKKYNAPILLTKKDYLYPDTAVEIKRLKAKKIVLIGGEGVLSAEIVNQLKLMGFSAGSITRLAGITQYDTALAVAQAVGVSQGIFVTGGDSFQDALVIAPIAAAQGMPILLVPSDDLTPLQKAYLGKTKISNAVFVGNTNQFSQKVMSYFPTQERISGEDYYERNVNLVERFKKDLNLDQVFVATSWDFPDGLAASVLAQRNKNPLFLVNRDYVPNKTRDFFAGNVISKFKIIGGQAVVSTDTEYALRDLPAQFDDFKDLTVRIQEKQKYELPRTVTMKKSTGEWEEVPVTWGLSYVSTMPAGTYYYEGKVEGYSSPVYLTLIVEPIPSKTTSITAEIVIGDSYRLPDTIPVIMSDNTVRPYKVTWSTTSVVTMNKVGSYSFSGVIEGTTLKATLNLKVSEDSVITFKDSSLEWVVREEIGRDNWSLPIYKSDVLGITSLDADGYGIADLSGLESFTNLEHLDLEDNALNGASLAPLSKLMNLTYLNLENNTLDQITSLKGLTNLTFLDVSDNQIADFSPIKGLICLNKLYLSGNASLDYSSIRPIYSNLISKDFSL